jgi:uncharacterized protein
MSFRLFVVFIFLLFAGCPAAVVSQSPLEGFWEGVMVREGSMLDVSFEFTKDKENLTGNFNAPTMRALKIPLRSVSYAAPKTRFELRGDQTTTVFDGEIGGETLSGKFRDGNAEGTFALKRGKPSPLPYQREEVSFRNGDTSLAGTLLVPLTKAPHPAVVFLHGSGPEDRYGSWFLAEQAARRGIAALIYDKRGVGASKGGSWMNSTPEEIAGDAAAGVDFLKRRRGIDPRKIGLYGHSNGGFIAPLVVSLSNDVAFVVSAASYGGVAFEQDIYRVRNALATTDFSEREIAQAMAYYTQFVTVARTGENWAAFETETERMRRERWFAWLEIPPKGHWLYDFYKKTGNYDPLPLWEKLRVPVLLIYGEKDRLIPVSQSIVNIERALKRAGNKDYSIVILPRAAHNFNISPDPGQPFEWAQVAPGFAEIVTAWINQRAAAAK